MTTADGNGGKGRSIGRRHGVVAAACAIAVLGMVGLSFAAVPLYRVYCQVTGYAGTTQRAEKASDVVLDRKLTVHFDANVATNLPWRFEPEQRTAQVKIGENTLALYKATNNSDHKITGTAVFNVTPAAAGVYFNKIECFCFTEQTLEPGRSNDMAVSFFIDPAFAEDDDTKGLTELTLSYTFYPVAQPTKPKRLGQAQASGKDGG